MRQLFLLLCAGVIFVSASSFNADAHSRQPSDSTKIEVVFNRQLEFEDLVKIRLELLQKGIVLDYQKLEFDKKGKLIAISFHVDCKDGFSGSASQSNLTNQSKFGFIRDYSKNVKIAFRVG